MVAFNSIPIAIRTPGFFAEYDNSRAVKGLAAMPHKCLIIGQKLTAGGGTAAVETPVMVQSAAAADGLFGVGSPIAEMCRAFKNANPYTELWAIALADAATGVAATGTVAITGTATKAGVLSVYVGDILLPVPVAIGDTASDVGAALDALSDAEPRIAAIGVNTTGTVAFTSRWKGTTANDIGLRLNYQQGELIPAGLAVTVTGFASGANDPDLDDAIAVFGDTQYHTIICQNNDATNIAKVEAVLADRFGPMVQKDGSAFFCKNETLANLSSFGNARNSPHSTVMGMHNALSPTWKWAAVVGATEAYATTVDCSRPRQTLVLKGIYPPAPEDRFIREERDVLLYDGISTFLVDGSGVVSIERLVTTYQTNGLGVSDTSYLDIETMRTLAMVRYTLNAWMALKFPRHKLADDGEEFAPGTPVVTPKTLFSETLAWFKALIYAGHAEGFEQFKNELIVERSQTDTERADAVIPTNLINGLRVFAAQIQFIK